MSEMNSEMKVSDLPLTTMDYSGGVEGTVANVQLKLAYQNKLSRPLEPIFTFPLPAEATVLGVTVKIGDRVIQSELKKAREARQDYDQAVSAGHQATLLEQHRDNIFTMSVGGIQPGENIDVTVRYNHPVEWQGGGRLIVPLVVAPHFVHGNPLERRQGLGFSPDTDEVPDGSKITPHVAADPDEITYKASVRLDLKPGFDAQVACPSHDALFAQRAIAAGDCARIELSDLRPDRDLTITYRGESRDPQLKADKTVWQGSDGQKEEFTLLQLMPGGAAQGGRRQVVLCLDCSGSMNGMPIAGLRAVVEKTVQQLRSSKEPVELGIIKFSDSPTVLMPLQPLEESVDVKSILSSLTAGGGTRASAALQAAIGLFPQDKQPSVERSIVFVTDGDTSDMRVDKAQLRGARIHSVGISTAVDHAMLKEVARISGGSTYWVYPGEDYDTATREIVGRTSGPVLRNLRMLGLPADAEVVGLGDVYASQPALIAIKSVTGVNRAIVAGESADGKPVTFDLTDLSGAPSVGFAHTIWTKIKLREGLNEEQAADLSLKYGVLSRATSFVAVLLRDRPGEKPERIEIPVSLPHGWEMEAGWAVGAGLNAVCARSLGGVRMRGSIDRMDFCMESLDYCPPSKGVSIDSLSSAADPVPALLDSARDLLSGVKHNSLDRQGAQTLWSEVLRSLSTEVSKQFKGWDEEQRAELFKLLGELRGYGFKADIPQELRAKPVDRAAQRLWREAQRSLGLEMSA